MKLHLVVLWALLRQMGCTFYIWFFPQTYPK